MSKVKLGDLGVTTAARASANVCKYLQHYAEPEAQFAANIAQHYGAVLVVPAFAENPNFVDDYRVAARAIDEQLLVIVVVNATVAAAATEHHTNLQLIQGLCARLETPRQLELSPHAKANTPPRITAWFGQTPDFDLLCVDRSAPGSELKKNEGVGRARKIGLDIALALAARGQLTSPWLYTTDADVRLPPAYFTAAATASTAALALIFPFEHYASGNASIDVATQTYEVALRYYVAGLRFAGSAYAYHSLGSTLAVSAEAYAAVRGVPPRAAGEDFYLLAKLAKMGAVERLREPQIAILSRDSARVPFGTGPRVRALCEVNSEMSIYHPTGFLVLRSLLTALDVYASTRLWSTFEEQINALGEPLAALVTQTLKRASAWQVWQDAPTHTKNPRALRHRLHSWFDALRTLQFIHALRDVYCPLLPWRAALAQAPFVPADLDQKSLTEVQNALRAGDAAHTGPIGVDWPASSKY